METTSEKEQAKKDAYDVLIAGFSSDGYQENHVIGGLTLAEIAEALAKIHAYAPVEQFFVTTGMMMYAEDRKEFLSILETRLREYWSSDKFVALIVDILCPPETNTPS